MADSMEVMILSILSPALHCAWGLSQYNQAFLTTVVFVGMMLSSALWGQFSDRHGRRQGRRLRWKITWIIAHKAKICLIHPENYLEQTFVRTGLYNATFFRPVGRPSPLNGSNQLVLGKVQLPILFSTASQLSEKALLLSSFFLFFYGLLSAIAPSFGWIAFLRFLVGTMIGCVPQSVTLFSEFLPTRQGQINLNVLKRSILHQNF